MPRCDRDDAKMSEYTSYWSDGYFQGRLNTFTSWKGEIPAEELAKAGFIYNGIKDKVACPVCHLHISNLKSNSKPLHLHVTYKPTCTFLQRNDTFSTESGKILHADKYPQYSDLQKRLESFVSWPLTWVAHTPEMMARSGFFYTGSADRVTCFSCGLTLRDWRGDHCPPFQHRKSSGDCLFIEGLDCKRIKQDIEELKQLMVDYDDYNYTERFNPSASEITFTAEGIRLDLSSELLAKDGLNITDAQDTHGNVHGVTNSSSGSSSNKYPKYADFENRLDSFKSWPLTWVAHTPEVMAKSGFFYIGSADRVTCFSCGITLRDWHEDDCPPLEHKKHSENCHFVEVLDSKMIKQDVDELEKLLVDFDDYNATEIFKPKSQTAVTFTVEGVHDSVETRCHNCHHHLRNMESDCDGPINSEQQPGAERGSEIPQFADYLTRLRSFSAWPLTNVAHTPEMMAKSGFFYIGSADRVRCFSCGITLRDWDDNDYPPVLHRMYSEDCSFVADLDIDSIQKEIEELEKLLVDFDDYNFTEIFTPKSKVESISTEQGVHCDFLRSKFVGCCPAKSSED